MMMGQMGFLGFVVIFTDFWANASHLHKELGSKGIKNLLKPEAPEI
jgi:hypothetical protein